MYNPIDINKSEQKKYLDKPLFKLGAYLLSQDEINKIKINPEDLPQDQEKMIPGIFDSSLIVGNIYISKNYIIEFYLKYKNNADTLRYIFVTFEKNKEIPSSYQCVYKKVNIEMHFDEINNKNTLRLAENIYHYEKFVN